MQANCLVFPSPQKFNIQPILYKIVLIPQNFKQNNHLTYHHYLNLCLYNDEDDFQKTIRRFNNQYMLRTKDDSKYDPVIQKQFHQKIHQHKTHHSLEKNLNQNFSTNQESYQYQKLRNNKNILNLENKISNNVDFQDNQFKISLMNQKVNCEQYIPCLFLPGKKDKIVVFFHANAQDITSSYEFLKMINIESQYSLLAMEYRGYSINKGEVNPSLINKDANRVIQYLYQRHIMPNQIIIFGRSIGCAVALSAMKEELKVYALVLLSPFLSLKKIAKQLYGDCAGWALKEGFDNQKNTLNINCPLLLIHGMKDTLVPYQHSIALFSQCKAFCQLKLIQTMSHSRFNFRADFIRHFQCFIKDLQQNETK